MTIPLISIEVRPMTKEKIWTEHYKIPSYLVNLRGKAGLYAVLNLIQDVGWLHAFHLQVRLAKNQGWVFTRQKLVMTDWPAWNEVLTLRTWLRPPAEPFLFRDYELFVGDRKIGECTSTFSVMDMETRKLAKVDWVPWEGIWRTEGHLPYQPQKISAGKEIKTLADFQVRNSDIDMNRHVNNTRYAQWILDSLPLELLKQGVDLHGYEVNFLAEAKSGDTIVVQQVEASPPTEGFGEERQLSQFQGLRATDGKAVFSALLLSTPVPV